MRSHERDDIHDAHVWGEFAQPIPLGDCLAHCERFITLAWHRAGAGKPLDGLYLCQGRNHAIEHCWVEIDGNVYDCCSLDLAKPFWDVPANECYQVGGFRTVRRFGWDEFAERVESSGEFRFWIDEQAESDQLEAGSDGLHLGHRHDSCDRRKIGLIL